jgi:excisionase family DNA binding protein
MSASTEAAAPRSSERRSSDAPALLDLREVAQLLHCSRRHVQRLAERRCMPNPVRLGTLVRWRRADIDYWIAAGCPTLVARVKATEAS